MRRRDLLLSGTMFAGLVLVVPALAAQESRLKARAALVTVGTTTELEVWLTNEGPDADDLEVRDGVADPELELELEGVPVVALGLVRREPARGRSGSRCRWARRSSLADTGC